MNIFDNLKKFWLVIMIIKLHKQDNYFKFLICKIYKKKLNIGIFNFMLIFLFTTKIS